MLKHIWPKSSIFNNCENPPWALCCSFRLSNEERQSKTQFQGQRLAINSHLSTARTTSARAGKCQMVLWIQTGKPVSIASVTMHESKQTKAVMTHICFKERKGQKASFCNIFSRVSTVRTAFKEGRHWWWKDAFFFILLSSTSAVYSLKNLLDLVLRGKKRFAQSCKGLFQQVTQNCCHTKLVTSLAAHLDAMCVLRIDTWLSPRRRDFASRLKPSIRSHFLTLARYNLRLITTKRLQGILTPYPFIYCLNLTKVT